MSIFSSSLPQPPPQPAKESLHHSEFASDGHARPRSTPTESDDLSKIKIPMAEVGLVNKRAQIKGTVTGITCGLLFALVTRNVLRQSANVTLVTGLATGTSAGYFSTRSNLDSGLRQLQEQKRALSTTASPADREREMNKLDLRAGNQMTHEGGVGGMYEWSDRGHSTRGDH
ncbi:hypothetical protein CBS101457_001074 [Exobasidium rhododendri]|nr:hypothetical protein CBS101457_001074 [Exobasidium rhododendri]